MGRRKHACGVVSQRVNVELDVFSGRPNPTWELDDRSGSELLARIERLPRTTSRTTSASLGYRGWILSDLPNASHRLAVRGDTIEPEPFTGYVLLDRHREIEGELVRRFAPQVEPTVRRLLPHPAG